MEWRRAGSFLQVGLDRPQEFAFPCLGISSVSGSRGNRLLLSCNELGATVCKQYRSSDALCARVSMGEHTGTPGRRQSQSPWVDRLRLYAFKYASRRELPAQEGRRAAAILCR